MDQYNIDTRQIKQVAEEALGFERLRPGQQAVIKAVLEGHDTLAVMPTGSGKSAIYQIAGELMEGATLVISPLIALQRDQVQSLAGQDVGTAALLNSTISDSERERAFADLNQQKLEFIFMAPEQLKNEEVLAKLRNARVSLFVVDEAHCISEWGHDFRPDYLSLNSAIEMLGHPIVLALTATAAPPVRREIVERLGMRDERIVVRGFDRPNIWLGVETYSDAVGKQRALIERVSAEAKPGIIYAATRKHAEELAAMLAQRGIESATYHAGMGAKERERVQQAFMEDRLEVIVATIAFGMGVDKPNVRFVFHYEISDSIDSYYQEIGRAGRDGEAARAVLFYCPEDLGLRRFFASSGQLDPEQVTRVVSAMEASDLPLDVGSISRETELSRSKVTAALIRLEELGAISKHPDGKVALVRGQADLDQAAHEAAHAQDRRREYDQSRVEMMRGYAEAHDCRRRYLLNYFGEGVEDPCGYCDNCEAGVVAANDKAQPFGINSRVKHRQWGVGQVMRYEDDVMVVLFDEVGYKNLAVPVVLEAGLVEPASAN